ncbi:MAG: DUF1015 domain-containing protein [Lachnospiraceae bacterium]|nr:DUF1015 domain-containing protein [Lachnospiraceae bacterium]
MADIRPFAAIRPAKEKTAQIAALPYDVYNRAEARAYVEAHPGCFLEIDRPETLLAPDCDMYAQEVYDKAHDELWSRLEKGDFVKDEKPCFYLYEQTFRGRTQIGIVACASVDDYQNNVIKKHENTREEKERDRIRHVDTCDAQTGPIFLCYRKRDDIDECIGKVTKSEPYASFEGPDGAKNRLFVIDNPNAIELIKSAFADTKEIYIADGHHRCASAVKVALKRREEAKTTDPEAEYNYFLCVLFADDALEIMDYNRVVKDLNGLTADALKEKIAEVCEVKELAVSDPEDAKPKRKGDVAMYLDGKWYTLTYLDKVKSTDPVEGLDVAVLQKHVLTPILGIGDPRTDARIDFVGGIRGLKELERRCKEDCKVAFSMYPTSIHELFDVADKGLLMPPKSTWFEPKLLSGLFIHALSS